MSQENLKASILTNDEYLTHLGVVVLDMQNQIEELFARILELENINANRRNKLEAFKKELKKEKHSPLRNNLEDFYPDDNTC